MAATTKKGSKTPKIKQRRPKGKTSVAEQTQTTAELRQQLAEALEREKTALKDLQDRDQQLGESLQREKATAEELEDCKRQLTEALEQQTATSEIFGVIASSPTDLQPVMEAIAENAARLCDSIDAQIYRVENDVMRRVASWGQVPVPTPIADVIESITRDWVPGRAVVERQTIHVSDIQTAESQAEYPLGVTYAQRIGVRTVLSTPLLREENPIGAILIRRLEIRPFTEKQIALLK